MFRELGKAMLINTVTENIHNIYKNHNAFQSGYLNVIELTEIIS